MDRNKITEVEKKIKQIDLKEKIQTTILEIQMPSSPFYLFTIFAAENSTQKIRLPISYCLFLPSKFPDKNGVVGRSKSVLLGKTKIKKIK